MADLAERFRTTIDLHEAGVQLMRQNLRRRYPDEDDAQIARRLEAWLLGPPLEIPHHRRIPWPRS